MKTIQDHETQQSETTVDKESQENSGTQDTEGAQDTDRPQDTETTQDVDGPDDTVDAEGTERAETPPPTLANDYDFDSDSWMSGASEVDSSDGELEDGSTESGPRTGPITFGTCAFKDVKDEVAALKAAKHKRMKKVGSPVKCERLLQQVSVSQ
jgi:hypothetical protein